MSIPIVLALIASIAVMFWLIRIVTASARRLEAGIDEYNKEREEQGPIDAYAELSSLMENNKRNASR